MNKLFKIACSSAREYGEGFSDCRVKNLRDAFQIDWWPDPKFKPDLFKSCFFITYHNLYLSDAFQRLVDRV